MLFTRRTWLTALLALCLPAFAQADKDKSPRVALETSEGRIVLELNAEKAPKTVENFLEYVRSGQYNGTIFHRVIPGFMIQGGGFTQLMTEKPTRPPIPNESRNGLKNDRGTIAMARKPEPNSATAQFFINLVDNDRLNYPSFDGYGYAVFGRVVEGMDVVDRIKAVETATNGPYQNVPVKPIVIREARILPK
jgi:peptidyl-prolyl cis-trans isomerase A (cyclophilin A)